MRRWLLRLTTAAVALLAPMGARTASSQMAAGSTAFVHVNVLAMEDDRIVRDQTVVVTGGRIAAVGPSGSVAAPAGATVIDGAGAYLLPGLTDAHVHIDSFLAPSPTEFREGPIYLAYGVTTVFNLWGAPSSLETRRRIATGELIGPTLYTAGVPVMGPRLTTAEEVRREVIAEAKNGYDFIKFYEGLSAPAYAEMMKAVRETGIPLVGHAPTSLGIDALLREHQPLAHTGVLSNVYFLPMTAHFTWVMVTVVAMGVLALLAVIAAFAAGRKDRVPVPARRIRRLLLWSALAGAAALVALAITLPGGPLFESTLLRLFIAAIALLECVAAVAVLAYVVLAYAGPTSRSGVTRAFQRTYAIAGATALMVVAVSLIGFWTPIVWRSTPRGIDTVAARIKDAGIPVFSTLVLYDNPGGPGRAALIADPAIGFLQPRVRDEWRGASPSGFPGYAFDVFSRRLMEALHRHGVTIVAGTDALGLPLIAPGSSMHRELELLTAAGFSPYEAIRAATVNPASFLKRDSEFGTITAGKRADLLLVAANPLENLGTLKRPLGVMTRGRWLTREELDRQLQGLVDKE